MSVEATATVDLDRTVVGDRPKHQSRGIVAGGKGTARGNGHAVQRGGGRGFDRAATAGVERAAGDAGVGQDDNAAGAIRGDIATGIGHRLAAEREVAPVGRLEEAGIGDSTAGAVHHQRIAGHVRIDFAARTVDDDHPIAADGPVALNDVVRIGQDQPCGVSLNAGAASVGDGLGQRQRPAAGQRRIGIEVEISIGAVAAVQLNRPIVGNRPGYIGRGIVAGRIGTTRGNGHAIQRRSTGGFDRAAGICVERAPGDAGVVQADDTANAAGRDIATGVGQRDRTKREVASVCRLEQPRIGNSARTV